MNLKSNNYNSIFHDMLFLTLLDESNVDPETGHRELFNASFELTDPTNMLVDSKSRNFNLEFAEKFYQWTIAGRSDIESLYSVNPNAKNFSGNEDNLEERNTAYGPRIVKQLPLILEELMETKSSRRAVINILDAEDKELLSIKRQGSSKMEFPCTNTMTYYIRQNKLHAHVSMRSNCLSKTICYDIYNQCKLLQHILEELQKYAPYANLELGSLYWNIVNGHILAENIQYSQDIIAEYASKMNPAALFTGKKAYKMTIGDKREVAQRQNNDANYAVVETK